MTIYDPSMQVLTLLPWYDWLALAWFFSAWVGYAWFARHGGMRRASLLDTTNRHRRSWMLQATARDPRVLDGIIIQSLSSSPSFFASATIIIMGGLLALLGTTDKAAEFVREIPFATRTSMAVFELKVLVLLGIFVNAFFRFTWSMRQYTFAALVIGSMPRRKTSPKASSSASISPTGPASCWAWPPRLSTTASGRTTSPSPRLPGSSRHWSLPWRRRWWWRVLYTREFHSEVLHVLRD